MSDKASFGTVRKLGLRLPGVEESTTYGKPSLKVQGKMFVCMASHRSAEPGSLAVRTDFEQRGELLAADPETYYITDHYKDYPVVLFDWHASSPIFCATCSVWRTAWLAANPLTKARAESSPWEHLREISSFDNRWKKLCRRAGAAP